MVVLSLFDGMSCGQLALGSKVTKYYASEIDNYAIKITNKNFPNTIELKGVCNWKTWDIDWASIDLLIGGSPCQGFSYIGKQLAFSDPRSALFFTYVDILNHIRKYNPNVQFLLENVAMKAEFVSIINEYLGVEPVAINSLCVVPQSRQRLYWASWPINLERVTKQLQYPKFPHPIGVRRHGIWCTRETATCIDANYSKGADNHGQRTLQLINDKWVKLTPEQCEALQGVPKGYTFGVSNTQRYKMLGNGWTVPLLERIFNEKDYQTI